MFDIWLIISLFTWQFSVPSQAYNKGKGNYQFDDRFLNILLHLQEPPLKMYPHEYK